MAGVWNGVDFGDRMPLLCFDHLKMWLNGERPKYKITATEFDWSVYFLLRQLKEFEELLK